MSAAETAEAAEWARPRSNPVVLAALRAADAKAGFNESSSMQQMTNADIPLARSFVSYAKAPMGAKKYDASTIGAR